MAGRKGRAAGREQGKEEGQCVCLVGSKEEGQCVVVGREQTVSAWCLVGSEAESARGESKVISRAVLSLLPEWTDVDRWQSWPRHVGQAQSMTRDAIHIWSAERRERRDAIHI